MPWMVVDLTEEQDEIHIAPSCWSGYLIRPHSLTYRCPCKPDFEDDPDGPLTVLHRDLERKEDV